jgi:hypothetical protein
MHSIQLLMFLVLILYFNLSFCMSYDYTICQYAVSPWQIWICTMWSGLYTALPLVTTVCLQTRNICSYVVCTGVRWSGQVTLKPAISIFYFFKLTTPSSPAATSTCINFSYILLFIVSMLIA